MASNFSIELFKVPFDNSYKKVFDINSIKDNIRPEKVFHNEILLKTPLHISLQAPSVSNIKRYNNNIIFTIKEHYFSLRNYNYIALYYDEEYYFYFITSIVSENDNPINPSVTITGEWDCWHNHLTDMYFNNAINMNTIIRAHEDRFEYSNYTYFTTFYRNSNPKTFTEKELNYDTEKGVYNDEYKMLWLRVTVADEFFTQYNDKLNGTYYKFEDKNVSYCTGIRPITNSNFRNVLYIPISIYYKGESVGGILRQKEFTDTTITPSKYIAGEYIYDPETGSAVKTYVTVNGGSIPLTKLPYINAGLNIMELYNESGITSYYKSVEYTFNAPYTIEFSKDKDNYYADIYAPFVRFNNILSGSSSYFGNAIIGMPDKIKDSNYTYIFTKIPVYINDNNTLTQDFEKMKELFFDFENEKIINCLPTITPITDINRNDSIEKEPKLFIYPYKYYSLYYNNSEYILDIPQNKSQYLRYIIYTNKKTSQPFIRILSRTDVPSNTDIKQINNGNIYLENSGEITYAVDALADYQIRNGAQEKTSVYLNMLNNIIKNGFNVVGVGSAITSGINDLTRIASKYVDLNNTPDNVILSNRGEDDIYIQDNVLIYENTCGDNMLIQEKYKEFYIYGYDYVKIDNITNNSRFWFDYKQTQNCKLNNPINLTDKQRIEQMFDDGVHMFHINYDKVSDTYIVNTTMEFNGKNNIERSIATI